MSTVPTIRFINVDCEVIKGCYANKQVSLELVAADTDHNLTQDSFPGEPFGVASVCLVDHKFHGSLTAIKNYSENSGILELLSEAGLVKETGQIIYGRHVEFPIVTVTF